jgi:hypothetical protein
MGQRGPKAQKHSQEGVEDWELVADACNPSYSGGRNQEDHSWKPAWANSSQDPISKNP